MPALRLPRTDIDRAMLLETAVKLAKQDSLAGRDYVASKWQSDAAAFVADYGPKVRQMAQLKSEYGREVLEKDTALVELETTVRDFWEGLERRIARMKLSDSLFTLYHLPRSGDNPKDARGTFWLETARGLVAADALAVAQGFTAMSNPSAAELSVVLAKAQKEYDEVPLADRGIGLLQRDLEAARPQADKLIKALNAQLDAALYELSDEAVRRIKRSYGFEFYTRPGEAVEAPEDTPEPAGSEAVAA